MSWAEIIVVGVLKSEVMIESAGIDVSSAITFILSDIVRARSSGE
jgi:hypothetical protein